VGGSAGEANVEVLDRYHQVGGGSPDQANVFTFYQMEVVLQRA